MRLHLFVLVTLLCASTTVLAQKEVAKEETKSEPVVIALKGTNLTMVAPENWVSKKSRFPDIITYEFAAPAKAKEGDPTAKITVSRAGGGVKANIARWESQMAKIDKDKSKTKEVEIAGQKVHLVDLHGSYLDRMGAPPMARIKPKVRENYRVMGAVIETKDAGLHFIKMIGPGEVVDKLAEPMQKMLKEMKAAK